MKPQLKTYTHTVYDYDDVIKLVVEKFGDKDALWEFDQWIREAANYPESGDYNYLYLDPWEKHYKSKPMCEYVREVLELKEDQYEVEVKW